MPTPKNGQTNSNNSPAWIADELFECVWPFCEVGAKSVNTTWIVTET